MGISLGMIEHNSIAQGILAADTMLKSASVSLVCAKATCPGKYISMVKGEVGAVDAAVNAACERCGENLVDWLIIPNVDETVCEAISAASEAAAEGALGVMEFFGMASAVTAADRAVKTARVTIIEVRMGMGIGGKAYVTLCGDVAAVEAAVEAGCASAQEEGMLLSRVVIPNPDSELFNAIL